MLTVSRKRRGSVLGARRKRRRRVKQAVVRRDSVYAATHPSLSRSTPPTRFTNRVGGNAFVVRGNTPIPTKLLCVEKYGDTILTGTPAVFQYQFRLNSTFDPDLTGGGHQPYGRDTLASLYGRYRVLSCSWVIEFPPILSTTLLTAVPVTFVVVPFMGAPVTTTSIGQAIEWPRAKFVTVAPGGDTQIITGKVSLNQLAGRGIDEYVSEDDYAAAAGANPAAIMTLNIIATTSAGTGGMPLSMPIVVCLSYFVEWFEPIDLAQS